MKLVIVESPFAGDIPANLTYARACLRDCLGRGEAPYASHLLYTQDGVLDDSVPEQRALGMTAGFRWGEKADETVVYLNRGVSPGMLRGIEAARLAGRPIRYRVLPGYPEELNLLTIAELSLFLDQNAQDSA